MRHLGLWFLPIALAGCASSTPRVAPVPSYAWCAAADSPRTSDPVVATHRDPVRPQTSTAALSREQVLQLASARDPQEAIAEIDRHPLAFPLSRENLGWFEDRVAPPELVDYLRKRAAVDWEALSKAPAPAPAPVYAEGESYPAPQPTQTPSTVYVEAPPPQTTIVYERTYYDPSYYGPGYCGPGYYGPAYCGPSLSYGGTVYVYGGGSYGHRTYYRPTYNYSPSTLTYRPGAPAGVYSRPAYNPYVYTPIRSTVVRTGNPTVIVNSRGGGGHHR